MVNNDIRFTPEEFTSLDMYISTAVEGFVDEYAPSLEENTVYQLTFNPIVDNRYFLVYVSVHIIIDVISTGILLWKKEQRIYDHWFTIYGTSELNVEEQAEYL